MVVRHTSILLFAAAVALAAPNADVHRLALADCDDVVFGPEGDLYLACHSPTDILPVKVRNAKEVPDLMDAYVLGCAGTLATLFSPRALAVLLSMQRCGLSWMLTVFLRHRVD